MFNPKVIKRIALAAVGVAAFSGVSATAQATGSPVNLIASATSVTTAGIAATQIAGVANSVTVSNTVVIGGGALPVYFTVSGGVTTTGTNSGTLPVGASVGIATTTAGTITVLGYAITAGAASISPTDVITITVIGSVPGTVYASSTVYGEAGTGSAPSAVTDAAFSVTAPSTATNVAEFAVSEFDANGVPVIGAGAKPIIVTVVNGLISSYDLTAPTAIPNTTYISAVPTTPTSHFLLSGVAGLGGTAVVTISVNGVFKNYKVTFTGPATKIVLTTINPVVGVGLASSILPTSSVATGVTANTNALEVQEFDASGTALPVNPGAITINSAAPGIATVGALDLSGTHPLGDITGGTPTSSSVVGVSVNGVSPGITTFIASDSSLSLTSAPASIRVSSAIPTSVVFSTNSPTYADGVLGTLTTTLSNVAGPVPAGTYVVFKGQATSLLALSAGTSSLPGAPTAVASVGGSIPVVVGEVIVKDDGTYTINFNAPLSDGTNTITATPTTNAISVTPATFIVGSGSSVAVAATVAANEANDAASASSDAATLASASADAASQAADSASAKANAALSAISALSSQVTAVLSKVAAISALLAKILKRVKA